MKETRGERTMTVDPIVPVCSVPTCKRERYSKGLCDLHTGRTIKGGVMRIKAWAYESDIHCNECAIARFGERSLRLHYEEEDSPRDSDGNCPMPAFSNTAEVRDSDLCSSCRIPVGHVGAM